MPDITKCKGGHCPMKNDCYRYTSESSDRQAFFIITPYDKEKNWCEYFWNVNRPTEITTLKKLKDDKRFKI